MLNEKWKGKLRHSLGNRLFLYFTLMMIIPLTLVGVVVYLISVNHISEMTLQTSTQIIEKISGEIDSLLTDMIYISQLVDNDTLIEQAMQKDSVLYAGAKQDIIAARLRDINEFRSDIDGIYVRGDHGLLAKSRYYNLREEGGFSDADYERVKNHRYDEWFVSETGSFVLQNRGEAVLAVAAALIDSATGRPNGVVIVEVRKDTVNTLLDVNIGDKGAVFLLNTQNELMSAPRHTDQAAIESARGVSAKTAIGNHLYAVDNRKDMLLFQRLPGSNWVIVGVIPKSFLRQNGKLILSSIVMIALLALLGNTVVARWLRDYELRPIRSMIAYVTAVKEGRFGEEITVVRPDEIGELALNMQNMSGRIESLMQAVREEQEQLRMAEFKAMQAQIHPHFLYNTLDSIAWLSLDGKNQSVVEMVQALTAFFRTGLSRGREIITIAEEVKHVRSYLTIQKMRYAEQFDYLIYVDPQVEQYLIPKLILQPLVENALYHGIKTAMHKCMLFINVLNNRDGVLFEILDNGAGMSKDKLQQLNHTLKDRSGKRAESFGLINVYDRIRILTKDNFHFQIHSEEGMGTSVTICMNSLLEAEHVPSGSSR